jgi:hypothetical protein
MHPLHSRVPWSFSCKLSCSLSSSLSQLHCTLFSKNLYCCSISSVIRGPKVRLLGCRRLFTKLFTHVHILIAFRNRNFSRMLSKQSKFSWDNASTVLMILASAKSRYIGGECRRLTVVCVSQGRVCLGRCVDRGFPDCTGGIVFWGDFFVIYNESTFF